MIESVERIVAAPVDRAGVPAWRLAASGAQALFLGRGAPERAAPFSAALLAEGVEGAWLRQVHSARVVDGRPGACGDGDALVVSRARLAAIVATADCVPILVVSGDAVAAVHAGWRGIAAGVVAATLGRLAALERAVAWIGPAIGPCCYEVGEEVAAAVVSVSDAAVRREGPRGRPHLDLAAAVALQLRAAGVGRVVRLDHCTRCHPEWLCSHRRDGDRAGRNLALIWRS